MVLVDLSRFDLYPLSLKFGSKHSCVVSVLDQCLGASVPVAAAVDGREDDIIIPGPDTVNLNTWKV
jgi:hypothetical protein